MTCFTCNKYSDPFTGQARSIEYTDPFSSKAGTNNLLDNPTANTLTEVGGTTISQRTNEIVAINGGTIFGLDMRTLLIGIVVGIILTRLVDIKLRW